MKNGVFTEFLTKIGKGEISLPQTLDNTAFNSEFLINYEKYQEDAKNRNKEVNEIR